MVFGFKSPQALLAEYLAEALAEYFVVNPSTIQTNLVRDARILLRDVALKEQYIELPSQPVAVTVTGCVTEVSFTWKWGGSDDSSKKQKASSSSWVQDATLTIRGLKFTARLSHCDGKHTSNTGVGIAGSPSTTTNKAEASSGSGGVQGYIREQVERIIDSLTLIVTDFEFAMELPLDPMTATISAFVVGGNSFKILSLGRQMLSPDEENATAAASSSTKQKNGSKSPLREELHIGSLYSNLVIMPVGSEQDDSNSHVMYPMLELFGYKAIGIRRSGRRFFTGIGIGLEVTGESNPGGLVVHAGSNQMRSVNRLRELVLAIPNHGDNNEDDGSDDNDGNNDSYEDYDDEVFYDSSTPPVSDSDSAATAESNPADIEHEGTTNQASVFHLPLSAVSLVLPNHTKVSLPELTMKYRADGSCMEIEGRGGIRADDHPLLYFSQAGKWCFDLVNSKFIIAEDHTVPIQPDKAESLASFSKEAVVFVHCRQDTMKKVIEGKNQLLTTYTDIVGDIYDQDDNIKPNETAINSSDIASPTETLTEWSVCIQGIVGIRLEIPSSDDSDEVDCEWMEAFIDSPSFLMSHESEMKFDSFQVGHCSHGQLSLCAPQTSLCLGGDPLMTVNGVIDVAVESKAVGEEVQGFLMRMLRTFQSQSKEFSLPQHSSLESSGLRDQSQTEDSTFSFDLAGVNFDLTKPNVKVVLGRINGNDSGFNCVSLFVKKEEEEVIGFFAIAAGLKVSIKPKVKVIMKELKSFHLPGIMSLLKPSSYVFMSFDGGIFCLKMTSLEAIILSGENENEEERMTLERRIYTFFRVVAFLSSYVFFSANFQKVRLVKSDEVTVLFDAQKFGIDVTPVDAATGASDSRVGIQVLARLETGRNKTFSIDHAFVSARINPDNINELHELKASTKSLSVTVNSAADWSKIIKLKKEKAKEPEAAQTMMLPHAFVAEMKFRIAFKGTVVSAKATELYVPTFKGEPNTSLHDMVKYYVGFFFRHSPDFMTHVEVLGANLPVVLVGTALGGPLGGVIAGGVAAGAGRILETSLHVKAAEKVDKGISKLMENSAFSNPLAGTAGDMFGSSSTSKAGEKSDKDATELKEGSVFAGAGRMLETYVKAAEKGGGITKRMQDSRFANPLGGIAGGMFGSSPTSKAIEKADKDVTELKEGSAFDVPLGEISGGMFGISPTSKAAKKVGKGITKIEEDG